MPRDKQKIAAESPTAPERRQRSCRAEAGERTKNIPATLRRSS
jgi:hypothetical protein